MRVPACQHRPRELKDPLRRQWGTGLARGALIREPSRLLPRRTDNSSGGSLVRWLPELERDAQRTHLPVTLQSAGPAPLPSACATNTVPDPQSQWTRDGEKTGAPFHAVERRHRSPRPRN